MKITASSKRLVSGSDFAVTVRALYYKFRERGMPEEENIARLSIMIAWAAGGREITERPTESELLTLQAFYDSNVEVLGPLIQACLKRAFALEHSN